MNKYKAYRQSSLCFFLFFFYFVACRTAPPNNLGNDLDEWDGKVIHRKFTAYDIGEDEFLYQKSENPEGVEKEDLHLFLHPSKGNKREITEKLSNWTLHEKKTEDLNATIIELFRRRPSEYMMINFRTHGDEYAGGKNKGRLCYQSQISCGYDYKKFIELLDGIEKKNKELKFYLKQILINPLQCYQKIFMDQVQKGIANKNYSFKIAYFALTDEGGADPSHIGMSIANFKKRIPYIKLMGAMSYQVLYEAGFYLALVINSINERPSLKTLGDLETLRLHLLEKTNEYFPAGPGELRQVYALTTLEGSEPEDFLLENFYIPTKLEFSSWIYSFLHERHEGNLPRGVTKTTIQGVKRNRKGSLQKIKMKEFFNKTIFPCLDKVYLQSGRTGDQGVEIQKKDWGKFFTFSRNHVIRENVYEIFFIFDFSPE